MSTKRRAQGPPTELEMREGMEPEPEGLVENAPEERPFFDRSDTENAYQQFLEEEAKSPVVESAEEDEGEKQVKEKELGGVKPDIEAQPPTESIKEEAVKIKAQVEEPPKIETKVPRFKDVSEAEVEMEKVEERRKNHEKKMHEATQEAAELKRQLKFIVDSLQKQPKATPPQEEMKAPSVLDLPREELAQAIFERPDEVIAELEKRVEERSVRRSVSTIENRVKEGTKQQTAKIFQDRLGEMDTYFAENYKELKPLEDIVGMVSAQMLTTPEGFQLLIKDSKKFVDKSVEKVRAALGKPALTKSEGDSANGGQPKKEEPPAVVQGEKREKLIASPVVKPSLGGPPNQEEEEPEITPAQYIKERQKIFDQITSGR
jgi:F0F1-type ATP synthase membrane subunit b/b'